MEPLDAAKNEEDIGSSKRRISSILKAPRTSLKFADPEQLETPVEVCKPVEKRNSRRVSFAPANDVLLFSKDVKNVAPARSPLQNLSTTTVANAVANAEKRVQVGVTEEGIQPITGMETLLNAPLHASQQRNKEIFTFSHDTEDDCREKTVMFTADDASMDVTHCHTIIIANDSESYSVSPDQHGDLLPTCGNMDFTFSMERRKGETSGLPRNISSTVHSLDPEFENFLASLSEPSDPRGNRVMTKVVRNAEPSPQETVDANCFLAQLKTQRAGVDKENQAPVFTPTVIEKPLNKTWKIAESSNRSVVFPVDDLSMDMTEAHTGHIVGNTSTDEPLNCLFPTPDLYLPSDHLKATEITLQQQSSKAQGCTSSKPNGVESTKNPTPVIDSKISASELPSLNKTRSKLDLNLNQVPHFTEKGKISCTSHDTHRILCLEEDTRYKTSPSESDDMDLTRSQTVAIEAESLCSVHTLQKKKQKSLSFITASSKTSNAFESDSDDMEFTSCQTRVIEAKNLDAIKASVSVGAAGPVRMSKDEGSKGEGAKDSNCEFDDMEITRSQTVSIDARSLHTVNPLQNQKRKSLAFITNSTKVSNTTEDECGMDMTKAFTVSIDHISQSDGSRMLDKPLNSLFPKTDHEMKMWRAEADSDDMEFTRCQTRVIEAKNLDVVKPLFSFGTGRAVSILESNKKLLSEDDSGIDKMARQGECTKYNNCGSDDMEITRSQTVAIDAKSLHTVNPLQNQKRKSLAFMTTSTKASNTSDDECGMDMTKAFTVSIDHISKSDGSRMSGKPLNSLFSKTDNEMKTRVEADSDDMEFTRCQTRVIEAKNLDLPKPLLSFSTGGPVRILESNKKLSEDDNGICMIAHQGECTKYNNCGSDDMEITRSQTVAIDAKSLHTVNSLQKNKRKSLAFMTTSTKASNTAEDECGMDMTKAFTVSIDHISQSDDSGMSGKPLNSLFPKTDHEMKTWRPEADSDDMEFTRCQTRVIEAKNLDLPKPLLSFSTGGPVSILESNKKLLSEDDNGIGMMAHQGGGTKYNSYKSDDMEITRSQTVSIDAKSLHTVNPLQKKKRKSLAFMSNCPKAINTAEDECGMDMTKAFTVSIDHISQSDGSRMLDKPLNSLFPKTDHEMGTLNKTEADQVFYKDGKTEDFREMIPYSDQSPRMDVKFHFGTEGFNNNMPISSDSDELEMTRTRTVSRDVYIADDTSKKNGNPDNFPQPVVPFEDQAHGTEAHLIDCRRNILDGSTDLGDMEMNRVKTIPMETKQRKANISLSTSVSPEDHEMMVTKPHTLNIEQLKAPRNALISVPVPECPFDNLTSHPDSLDSKEMESRKDPEVRHENGSLSQGLESSPNVSLAVPEVDKFSSRNAQTRRMSLVDLQSKLRRLSHIINEDTDNMDSCTAPLSEVDKALDKKSIKTKSLPVVECELEMGLTDKEDDAQSEHVTQGEQPCITAPLNLKTKCLTSRLSLGGFMPKLPQRSKPVEPNKVESSHVNSVREHMKANTIDVTHQLSNNILMDQIIEEVLPNISSDEDSLETLDTQRIGEKESPPRRFDMDEPLEEDVFEESFPSVVHGKKRPLPVDYHEDHMEDEKRRKPSTNGIIETGLPSHVVQCDSNITASSSVITQTIDPSNNSNTANIRCEATFESTFKQSLLESQLQDCTNDIQKKLDDDSITVLEFFKLFSFDFVIHNPRQSILPGKLASNVDRRPKDLLKDRHINHPKQRVYEADYQNLTEKVEGLKARMKDREKLLKSVNRPLWEEMRGFSEKELKCFGAKLKERSNFLRKRSKVQSHEIKEVLYSNLLQANLEEQQKLRGKIEETDEMMKSLDDCIHELETELSAVEGKGLEDSKPTLVSRQQGLEKFTKVLADNEKQMCELEMKKKHNLDKLNRLRNETRDLESDITILHRVNEWKFGEQRGNCTVYTFLFESLHLELVFEKCAGNDAADSERKISDISFKFQLDGEKSQCHAHLVHKLLSQYIEGETAWVKKYPTSSCVPKLLHDVGLVVSRCRLLGEEVRLLKMWGALRLDILDISCEDTQVHIVFSSLKAFSKFEFTITVSETYPYCLLQVQNFKSHIGSTTIQQVQDIVLSVTPAKNYFTKIVKKIHDTLLC